MGDMDFLQKKNLGEMEFKWIEGKTETLVLNGPKFPLKL